MRNLVLAVAVCFVGCGDADSVAEVGQGGFAAEEEVGTTSDALVSNSAQTWLPMQEGNTWTLTSSSGAKQVITFSDVGDGIGWLDGLSRNGEWTGLTSEAPNSFYSWSVDQGWIAKYRFGYAYTPWSIGAGCDKFTLERAETDVSVVTPAGTFANARTLSYRLTPPLTARCVVPQFASVTFAPSVGPVKVVTGAGEKFVLTSAKVNGKVYPVPTPVVTATLTFDKASYTNKTNTIVCITTPCPGNAVTANAKFTYTIKNGTPSTQTWQFSTGCQYELALSDSTGKAVRALSNGRICTQSLTNIVLAPGATKVINGSVDLTDDEGLQLKTGRYTAKASLMPRLPSTPANATSSFQLTTAPAVP